MNSLDEKCLINILEQLDLFDLANCVQVFEKCEQFVEQKKLFVCYGTKFIKKKYCFNGCLFIDQKNFIKPHYIFNKTILNIFNQQFLKNIKTFIYHGNGSFIPPNTFNFYDFPKLKYLEIMDLVYCFDIIVKYKEFLINQNHRKEWKYFSPSIETLVIKLIDINILLSNLLGIKFIVIDKLSSSFITNNQVEKTNWKSLIVRNHVCDDFSYSNDKILKFLLNKSPYLETLEIPIISLSHFEKILKIKRLKRICLKINLKTNLDQIPNFEEVISKYEGKLKNDCSLCLNNFPVRCSNDFRKLFQDDTVLKDLFAEFMEQPLELDESKKIITFNDVSGIKLFEKFDKKDYIEEVYISDGFNSNKDNLLNLFLILPYTIKKLSLDASFTFNQKVLNIIPRFFSYLEELSFYESGKKLYDFKFILELKYLKHLVLHRFNIDLKEFVNSSKNLFFLSDISIVVGKKKFPKVKKIFLYGFFKNKLPYLVYLSINEKCIIYENSPENIKQFN